MRARRARSTPAAARHQLNVRNPYEGNAYAISEGQRLFSWYNCSGCHANGGGGIGPPLIKKDQRDWIYGGEPSNIFDTIVKGRPNGMPTWGGKIPEYQVWQIVTYVRSLNNLEPKAATPARTDSLEQKTATILPDKARSSPASMNQSMWHASGSNAAHIQELAVFFGLLLSAIFLIVVGLALLSLRQAASGHSAGAARGIASAFGQNGGQAANVVGIATGITVLILFGLTIVSVSVGKIVSASVAPAGSLTDRSDGYAMVVEGPLRE